MALTQDDTTVSDAPATFQWGAGGARMTPEQIAAQRKVTAALAANGADYSPIRSVWQGVARAAQGLNAGLAEGRANAAEQANADANKQMIAALLSGGAQTGGGTPAASAAAPSDAVTAAPSAAPAATVDTTGKIYSNDESSPLDPPSGADRDAAIRTVYGEAANEPTQGQLAVASVIRNRAVDGGYGGNTPTAVVQAPNQFEPWNGGPAKDRMLALSPNDPKYAAIGKVVDAAYGTGGRAPDDPTEGKTMFYSPGAQAALGRPAPAWAKGDGQVIGGHTFYDDEEGAAPAAAPVKVASADASALPVNATATQGALPTAPGVARVSGALGSGALGGINPAVLQAATSPYADDATKKIAGIMLATQLGKEKKDTYSQTTDADGNVWSINNATGQRTVAKAADKEAHWGIVGKDQYGQPTYGYPPSREEAAATAKAAASAPVADQPDLTNVHGKEYMGVLSKQDPKYASQVQSILEGRSPYPTGMLLKTPYGQKLAQDVTQADPTFEAGNATARVKVRNEFESGGVSSPAGQITVGNTAIQHAGEMSDALERLKADSGVLSSVGSSDIPYVSRWANELHNSSVQGTSAGAPLNDFMTAKNHFAEEVTKFYAGSAGSEAERTRALANLDAAKSLPELRSAIKTEAKLMQGKVNALQDRWRTGMGPLVSDFPLVQPKSQAAIDRIMQRDAGVPSAAPVAAAPSAPSAAPPPAVAKLAQNPTPEMQAHFDEIFGAGAAARALGGGK